jgi:hypothetical protein
MTDRIELIVGLGRSPSDYLIGCIQYHDLIDAGDARRRWVRFPEEAHVAIAKNLVDHFRRWTGSAVSSIRRARKLSGDKLPSA